MYFGVHSQPQASVSCRAIHSALGCAVTPSHQIRRRDHRSFRGLGGVNLKNLRDIFLLQVGSVDLELVLQRSQLCFIGVSGFRKPRNLV